MSVLGLIDESKLDPGAGGIDAPSTTFQDVFNATFESTRRVDFLGAKAREVGNEIRERNKRYREITGRNIYDDAIAASPNANELRIKQLNMSAGPQDFEAVEISDPKMREAVDQFLTQIRGQDENFSGVRTYTEVEDVVREKALAAFRAQQRASAGATPFAAGAGALAAGLSAGFTDPINLATIPLGAGMAAGVIRTALTEAAINAGTEVAIFPSVKAWRDELGLEYGLDDLAFNVGVSALFGAAVGGTTKGIQKLANSAKMAEMRASLDQIRDGDVAPTNPVLRDSEITSELSQALRHEERRLYIDESNPSRYSDQADPAIQQRALDEVDAALNEGRPIRADRIEASDELIAGMNPRKMDDLTAQVHARIMETPPTRALRETPRIDNDILDFRRPETPQVDTQKKLLQAYNSPEFRRAELAEFDRVYAGQAGTERIYGDTDADDISADALRAEFKNDKDYLDIINACGIGGG